MPRGLGIELDSDGVRALALEGGKRPRILAVAEQAIDPDEKRPWAERAREAVKAAVAAAGGPRGRIAASIDSGDAILRELQLPFTNDEQIRKTVRFELEQHIHNYAIEDLVVDFVKTASTEKGSQILVAAVPKTLIEERLQLLESAGADPAVVDLDALALFNALMEAGAVRDDAPILAMHGGSRFTKFLLIENRRPRAIRTLRYSTAPPAPEAAPSIDVAGPAEVEGGPDAEPLIVVDSSAPVDILAIEAGRFLMASAASGPPARILITGRLDLEAIAAALKEATGADAEYVDLLSKFGSVASAVQGLDRRLPVALGLALKAVERDATATDFRRDEFSYSKKFENVKSSALVLVSLVAMMLALVALHLYFKGTDLQRDTELVLSYQAQVVADAVNHDPTKVPQELKDDPTRALEYMRKMVAEQDAKLGNLHPIEQSSLQLIGRIAKSLDLFHKRTGNRPVGGEPFFIQIDNVNATQDPQREFVQITITGQAANTELAEAFRVDLMKAEPFKNGWLVEAGPYTTVKDNMGFTFTIKKGKG